MYDDYYIKCLVYLYNRISYDLKLDDKYVEIDTFTLKLKCIVGNFQKWEEEKQMELSLLDTVNKYVDENIDIIKEYFYIGETIGE